MNKMNGLESIALGLLDGGGQIFTNFPGYQSHKLFSLLKGKNTSVNEKIAYEIAWGSSLAGKRSAVMFKNVGLNDAADPFLNSTLVGVNSGLVLLVFDDVFVEGSQSRQDSRHYFDFYKGLWFEPYSIQNAYDIAYKSFALSEKFKIPVVIRITNQLVGESGDCKRKEKIKKSHPVLKNQKQYVIHPINSKYQRTELEKKNLKIQKFVENLYKNINKQSDKPQLIIFGCSNSEESLYNKEAMQKIRFYTYPLPSNLKRIINIKQKIVVIEQGDSFGYQKIKNSISSGFENLISNTGLIPDKSGGYIVSKNYEKVFSVIKNLRHWLVIGDLGEYTKDNLDTVDACLSFGSSPAVAIGCNLAGIRNVVSIIGDGAYLHSGKNSITEAISRNIPLKVIVVCNGGSQGTGGQVIPGDLYYQPKEALSLKLDYKKSNGIKIEKTISKMMKSKKVCVLYLEM